MTLIEMVVVVLITAIIFPLVLGLVVGLVEGTADVHDTMSGVQQDQTAGEALLEYLHGTTVILTGSDATTLNATILVGLDSTSTAQTATLSATLANSASPKLDATFTTSLTPAGGNATSTQSYDAVNSSSVFTYYYDTDEGSDLSSTTDPTDAELSEIVAVGIKVTFLAGPHTPTQGFQSVRSTNFVTTIYLQNASGDPAPVTTTTLAVPTDPTIGEPATLTATVAQPPSGGTVTFTLDFGASALSDCTSPVDVDTTTGEASCTFTPASSGTYSASAAFSGSSGSGPSSSGTVTFSVPYGTTTSLKVQGNKTCCTYQLILTAKVTSTTGTPSGTVTFDISYPNGRGGTTNTDGTTNLDSSGTASYTDTNLNSRTTYTVTATYAGEALYSGSTSTPPWVGEP